MSASFAGRQDRGPARGLILPGSPRGLHSISMTSSYVKQMVVAIQLAHVACFTATFNAEVTRGGLMGAARVCNRPGCRPVIPDLSASHRVIQTVIVRQG